MARSLLPTRSRRPAPVAHRPTRLRAIVLAVALPALALAWCGASAARAGTVLVSRDSYIEADGGASGAPVESNGTGEFGRFASDVSAGATPLSAEAHQYSVPGVTGGTFQGAFAEGSVQTTVTGTRPAAAPAWSNFDLTFRVSGPPQAYSFGAAMGTTGAGATAVSLLPLTVGTGGPPTTPVFSAKLAPGLSNSQTLDKTGVLPAGLYVLKVGADTNGATDDASAYYSINLMLPAAPANAAPLPPAAWSGAGVLLAVCGSLRLSQWRRGGVGPLRRAA